MTTLEDLRAELRQMCRAIGLSGTAVTVVPLVVLGVALNVVALSAVGSVRVEHHTTCERPALRSAAQTEFKVVRTLVTTLKRFGDGQRKWCSARQQETAHPQVELSNMSTEDCSKS
jgi:hypothetical protein